MNNNWNPWKLVALGMGLVMVTAVVTGVVVANRLGPTPEPTAQAPVPAQAPVSAPAPARAAAPPAAPVAPATPTQSVVDACNQYAVTHAEQRDKTLDTVKNAVLGAVAGAAVGAAGGAIADGGKGAGKGAAIGGLVGAGGGTLYGLNENRKQDEQYRAAYSSCMRSRGYAG